MISYSEYLGLGLVLICTVAILHTSIYKRMKSLRSSLSNPIAEQKVIWKTTIWTGIGTFILYTTGWFFMIDIEKKEVEHLNWVIAGMAPTLSYELSLMGHSQLTEKTSIHDPRYLQITDKLKNWEKLNPSIREAYTLKKLSDGLHYFVVDPETDFNKNGVIDSEIEKAVPIGKVYPEVIPELEEAFQGIHSIQPYPTTDDWGFTISAFTPIYDEQGKVNAVLGLDFDGEEWRRYLRISRLKVIGMLLFPFSLLFAMYWIIMSFRIEKKRLIFVANHDALTGLPNRQWFSHHLMNALDNADQTKQKVGVIVLDLDRFKFINDTLGHGMGDLVIQAVSLRLKSCVENKTTVARLGGDEFAILLPDLEDVQETSHLAQKLLHSLSQAYMIGNQELFITASIGMSVYPFHGKDSYTIMRNADVAMYRAKEQGRNNFQFYSYLINASTFEKLLLENNLRKAVENDELEVYYQPQLHIKTGEIIGAEALIRWHHPDMGVVSPAQFIPLAEETGLIIQIGEWVMRTACRQAKTWIEAGYPPIRIAVNLSAIQFQQDNLVTMVKGILQETGIEPHYVELEITESVAMKNTEHVIADLIALREIGIKISMDDFGTGYSSLNNLKNFPIHCLKLDKSFVRDIAIAPDDAAIATSIINMAHTLKLDVLAEGVETEEQLDFLRKQKCDYMQGYLFSPPVPVNRFEQLLLEHRTIPT